MGKFLSYWLYQWLDVKDYLGKTIKERVYIYNPMFYLNSYYKRYGTSEVADYFRINTGIS